VNITLEQLDSIVGDVLTTVGGLTVERRRPDATPNEAWVASRIEIRGHELVELQLLSGRALAATLASAFFGEAVAVDCDDDVNAAMLELANIVAGHVGALMEPPRRIGSPVLDATSATESASAPDLVVAFTFAEDAVVVTMRVTAANAGPVR
jgi:hypothetical protein